MARLVAAFGSSHSTMLLSPLENWLKLFDHIDVKAPINDFSGEERSFQYLLEHLPADAAARISPETVTRHFEATAQAIVGDDQREIFKDNSRPAIGIYTGETIRNAPAPSPLPEDWYFRDQSKRLEDGAERHYPCHAALGTHLIEGLTQRDFDITAIRALIGEQFEGHAYSFVHRQYMREHPVAIVPVFLNTYYPPNVPTPTRCLALGRAIRALVEAFPQDLRVGIMASGGLSHFLVNESLDNTVVEAMRRNDTATLSSLSPSILQSGSSEIRNWICLMGAIDGLTLDWLTYVPAYRSRALTGVGLGFGHWC
jgi:Catalytic LigB subunit of aromatic ring-opening dioxygenase